MMLHRSIEFVSIETKTGRTVCMPHLHGTAAPGAGKGVGGTQIFNEIVAEPGRFRPRFHMQGAVMA